MRPRPSDLSKTPTRPKRGDVLADVLSLGFLRNVLHRQLDVRAPWRFDVEASNRAALYLIARGHARLSSTPRTRSRSRRGTSRFFRGALHTCCAMHRRRRAARRPRSSPRSSSATARRRRCSSGRQMSSSCRVTRRSPVRSWLARSPASSRKRAAGTRERPVDAASRRGASRAGNARSDDATRLSGEPPPGTRRVVGPADPRGALAHSRASRSRVECRGARRARGPVALGVRRPVQRAARRTAAPVPRALANDARCGAVARHARADRRDRVCVGYDSTPSFNKAFKRWKAASPGEYRKASEADRT